MANRPISILGVPVRFDAGFVFGTLFIFQVTEGTTQARIYTAVALAAFTLIHELGHALTAKRFGCRAQITLSFFVGWAHYQPGRPLKRWEHALISLMGPLTQLIAAAITLTIVRHYLLLHPGLLLFSVWRAVIWAGVLIALLNLVPLWPLDGSHIIERGLDRLAPGRGTKLVVYFSIAALSSLVVLTLLVTYTKSPHWLYEQRLDLPNKLGFTHSGLSLRSAPGVIWEQIAAMPARLVTSWTVGMLLLFSGYYSFKMLGAIGGPAGGRPGRRGRAPRPARPPKTTADVRAILASPDRASGRQKHHDDRAHHNTGPAAELLAPPPARPSGGARIVDAPPPPDPTVVAAERAGWEVGRPGAFPAGWGPSPWLSAHLARRSGDWDGAGRSLALVAAAGEPRWCPPDHDRPELAPLAALLPRPLPLGDPARALIALRLLARNMTSAEIAELGRRVYDTFGQAEALYLVAASLARSGQETAAVAWLARAAEIGPDLDRVTNDPAFKSLRHRPDFDGVLTSLRGTSAWDRPTGTPLPPPPPPAS